MICVAGRVSCMTRAKISQPKLQIRVLQPIHWGNTLVAQHPSNEG